MELANQIVDSVRDLHLDMKGLSLGQLGVSIGVTTFPDLNTSTTELIKAADTALYQAKDNGRSQAVHTQSKEYLKQLETGAHSESRDVLPLKL